MILFFNGVSKMKKEKNVNQEVKVIDSTGEQKEEN